MKIAVLLQRLVAKRDRRRLNRMATARGHDLIWITSVGRAIHGERPGEESHYGYCRHCPLSVQVHGDERVTALQHCGQLEPVRVTFTT